MRQQLMGVRRWDELVAPREELGILRSDTRQTLILHRPSSGQPSRRTWKLGPAQVANTAHACPTLQPLHNYRLKGASIVRTECVMAVPAAGGGAVTYDEGSTERQPSPVSGLASNEAAASLKL
eukprot:CAMPEP_0113278088 /NCGR_PEP_ID=MMETSP0008_2-20120614/26410_1 /TAXON_ID=97485 /ORGANISM="Prymnesium parvum" /LENGTH=122 /DNA_ID=CAMNT_0000128073 /DNA_START=236 /DNA_END=603 /DNA_ORIENTATION=+ /assembly_acc=CAM_ASM_000153